MIRIYHDRLFQIAEEHFEGLKEKIEIPEDALREILFAKPKDLESVAETYQHYASAFTNKYDNFITKKREYNAYDLANKLEINVCPYCNENSTYTIIRKKGEEILRPEFDHFYDKATYPVLSLSFYNLIPCCHICNSTLKGSKEFSLQSHIHPYHDSFDAYADFRLHVEKSCFYHDSKGFEIKLDFNDIRAENSAKVFEIKKRYEKHKDIVLELIHKAHIYPESYIDDLLQQYEGTLFKNREDILRMALGGYVSDEEIGKRPLSKLIKDIAKELDIR